MGTFRLEPVGQPQDYQTYSIASPRETHTRTATCDEVDCEPFLNGWATTVPTGGQLEAALRASGRHWATRMPNPDGTVTFAFPPGQPCFRAATHRVGLDRPAHFLVRGGDWRGNPRGTPPVVHVRPDDWVEDFALHQQRIRSTIEKG